MILDALSASGLRSIRYAKELGEYGSIVKKIVANDISDVAVDLIKKNILANSVSDIVTSSLCDANTILHSSSRSYDDRFHVIDLDPFGTGAQFFDSAVRSIGEAGLLMVTCTDTAVLCGNASESCFARYGSMSLRAEFCHEAALRIILRSIESHAAVYGRYIKPLLSLSVDFYVRLFIQVFTQPAETKKSASKLSQIFMCKECKTHELNPLGTHQLKDNPDQAKSKNDTVKFRFKPADLSIGDRCQICDGKYVLGGPIWSAPIHDESFLALLKNELDEPKSDEKFATHRRIRGMIYLCSEELNNPLLFSRDTISSVLKMKMPSKDELMSAFVNAGYKVSLTHTNKTGFKTDAPSKVVWDIFCQFAEKQGIKTDDSLAKRIMSKPRDKQYDFTYNPSIVTESVKQSMLRFQINPSRDWGPKPRPVAASSCGESEMDQSMESKKRKISKLSSEDAQDG